MGTTFLTGSVSTMEEVEKTKQIKLMNQRMPNQLVQSQPNILKIINDKPLLKPITERLRRTLGKTQSLASLKFDPMDRKRQTLSNSQSQVNVDLPVNTNRYTEKVKSLGQKTFSFAALPREE